MDLKDMDWNLEEMTPEERRRFEYLRRVAQILRMPPDELIKECDEIMAKNKPEPIGPPNDAIPPWKESDEYIPLALRK
jgi:predicted HAD superfamily phosphohydrolase